MLTHDDFDWLIIDTFVWRHISTGIDDDDVRSIYKHLSQDCKERTHQSKLYISHIKYAYTLPLKSIY